MTDADGEQLETQHWLEVAVDVKYITAEIAYQFLQQYATVGRMLNSMITKANTFCSK